MVSPVIFSSGHEPAKRLIRHFLRPLASNPVGRWQEIVSVRNKTYFSRHCEQATTEPVKGDIKGKLPAWLEGTLIRNGPGIQKIGQDEYKHVFDGLAILHRYHIENGQVTYTSRPLESDTYKTNMAANRIVVAEFGTTSFRDPCKTLFQKLQSSFSLLKGKGTMTDNCSVNVAYCGDQLYAMTETNLVRRVDPSDLKTIGKKTNLTKYAAVNHATAHPHVLPDGSVLNMGSSYQNKRGPMYSVYKIPPTFGQEESAVAGAKVVAEVPFSSKGNPCYYHSFGMTTDKIIFVESPLRLNLLKLMMASVRQIPFSGAMAWKPNLKTIFHVASIEDGKMHPIRYESDPFFTFHHINAFEEDGQIVVDVAAYNDGRFVEALRHEADDELKAEVYSNARRFVLPLNIPEGAAPGQNLVSLKDCSAKAIVQPGKKKGELKIFLEPEHLSTSSVELPRINYHHNGVKYNYFYGISINGTENTEVFEPDSITKTDISNRKVERWSEKGMNPSEPIFVANPNGKDEDDGVVLTALSHIDQPNAVTLLVLDAKTMKETARISFKTAGTFTTTFHGQWAGSQEKIHLY